MPEILAIFDAAAAWLVGRGLGGQWGEDRLSGDSEFVARIGTWIDDRLAFLAVDGAGSPHGCLVTGIDPPPYLAPETAEAAIRDAAYVYTLASDMAPGSPGVGVALLSFAASEARQLKKRYLRLDCWADNPRLVAYYRRHGFATCGDYTEEGWHGSLMELSLDRFV